MSKFTDELKKLGLNIHQLGLKLDVSSSYLYEMNSGKKPPSYYLAYRIEGETNGAIPMNYWATRKDLKSKGGPEWLRNQKT